MQLIHHRGPEANPLVPMPQHLPDVTLGPAVFLERAGRAIHPESTSWRASCVLCNGKQIRRIPKFPNRIVAITHPILATAIITANAVRLGPRGSASFRLLLPEVFQLDQNSK